MKNSLGLDGLLVILLDVKKRTKVNPTQALKKQRMKKQSPIALRGQHNQEMKTRQIIEKKKTLGFYSW